MTNRMPQTPQKTPQTAAPHRAPRAPALILGLALAGVTVAACTIPATADDAGRAAAAPLRCEIALTPVPGGTSIAGRVTSDRPVAGTYAMTVTSHSAGGGATIRQSGDFEAGPGRTDPIAETRLTGGPAQQQVELQIHVGSQRLTCADAAL